MTDVDNVQANPKPRKQLVYPVVLDDGYMAQLVLPYDLSKTEVLRLRRLLWSLAVPWRDKTKKLP